LGLTSLSDLDRELLTEIEMEGAHAKRASRDIES